MTEPTAHEPPRSRIPVLGELSVLARVSLLITVALSVITIILDFGLHIDEDVYNTVGGYVLGRLGRRARLGDRIEVERRTMRVEALDGLRVARVFISRERGPGRRDEAGGLARP